MWYGYRAVECLIFVTHIMGIKVIVCIRKVTKYEEEVKITFRLEESYNYLLFLGFL